MPIRIIALLLVFLFSNLACSSSPPADTDTPTEQQQAAEKDETADSDETSSYAEPPAEVANTVVAEFSDPDDDLCDRNCNAWMACMGDDPATWAGEDMTEEEMWDQCIEDCQYQSAHACGEKATEFFECTQQLTCRDWMEAGGHPPAECSEEGEAIKACVQAQSDEAGPQ